MTMARRVQLGTQKDNHDHNNGQKGAIKNKKRTTMATTMVKRSIIKNTRR
jgi:hypothetical protein